jgi:hypothetical protein
MTYRHFSTPLCSLFLVMGLLLPKSFLRAQSASQYLFTPSKGVFTYLAGANTVQPFAVAIVPIGFSFNFCGTNYDYIRIEKGWATFDTAYAGPPDPPNSAASLPDIAPAIFPLWSAWGYPNPLGFNTIIGTKSYLTSGTAPNRVFTIEWRNYRWWWDDLTSANISFQVQLHETTNEISFRYKSEKPLFGMYPTGNLTYGAGSAGIAGGPADFLCLSSFVSVPVASSANFSNALGCTPATGQVYTFTPPAPCSAVPIAGSVAVPADPWNLCMGNFFTLIDTGYSRVSGLGFQWQSSPTGSNWTDLPGATDYNYTYVALSNAQYRLRLTCLATQDSSFTAPVSVTAGAAVTYQPLPYIQDFEDWSGHCDKRDVPGPGWANTPATGQNSWARDDQGYFAGWGGGLQGSEYNRFNIPNHVSGEHSALLPVDAPPGQLGNLDLHLDCSGQTGSRGLYFYYLNYGFVLSTTNSTSSLQLAAGADSLVILLSTNGGSSFSRLAAYTTDTFFWEKKHIDIPSNSPTTVLRFQGTNEVGSAGPLNHICIDSVFVTTPCSAMPVGGTITPGNTLSYCPGSSFKLTSLGATMAGGIKYQWEYSDNGGSSWMSIVNDTNLVLRVGGLYDTTLFRMKVICNTTGQTAFSNTVTANIQPPNGGYAALPFIEDFETWQDQCDTADVPGLNGITHWAASPPGGEERFVREDAYGMNVLIPQSVKGAHSAMSLFGGSPGGYIADEELALANSSLDLLVNCSPPGNKTLQFYLNNRGHANPSITDQVKLYLSTNGGASFEKIGSFDGTSQWEYETLPINSNSAQTVLRFSVEVPEDPNAPANEIGLDYLKMLLDCSGKPSAGTIDSVATRLCANQDFYLSLSGTSAVKLNYKWQRSANGTTWSSIPGATTDAYLYSISSDTWFRCIVTCSGSGLSDTSAPKLFQLLPFYFCYCNASPYTWMGFSGPNIGSATLSDSSSQATLVTTGSPFPLQSVNGNDYHRTSDYMDLPIGLFRDTTYKLRISELWSGTFTATSSLRGFMDFNRDGIYDPVTEMFFEKGFSDLHPVDSQFFHLPSNSGIGYTGMRLIMKWIDSPAVTAPLPTPCDYDGYWGEVEDYVVYINYAPCNGPLNAGIAAISDTLVFSGGTVQLINTSHANPDSLQLSQIAWIWQSSADGVNWTDIPGSEMQDTIDQIVTVKTWFRLKMICQHSSDTSYSNTVYANIQNTGVATTPGSEALQLYPNPTTGKLNLKYLGAQKHALTITVSDISGKQLSKRQYLDIDHGFTAELDLSGYAKGVYLIQTTIDNQTFNNRIILK